MANDEPNDGHGRGEDEESVSTYLVIPYFAGDRGRPGLERPLGSSIVWWLCPSIIVNDQPGKNTFQRGVPTKITVDVANWGSGTAAAPVHVQVWWADPTTGFTTKQRFGQAVLAVPTGGGRRRSPPMVGIIPTSAPPHVCLLANVSSPLDSASVTAPADPVGDRHWAQLNLTEVSTSFGQPFQLMIWVGNPFDHEATFEVTVRPLAEEAFGTLARLRSTEIVGIQEGTFALWEGRRGDEQPTRGEFARHRLTLEPGRRRAVHIAGELPFELEPGTEAAFEIVQTHHGDEEEPHAVGAFGVVVTAAARR
jgi:hypothetical protein